MTSLLAILKPFLSLFVAVAAGFAAGKTKLVSGEANRAVSRLLMNVTLPLMMVCSILGGGIDLDAGTLLGLLGVCAAAILLGGAAGWLVMKLCRTPARDMGVYTFCIMFGNTGFMGIPVAEALLGARGVFYTTLYVLAFNLLSFTLGVAILGGRGSVSFKKILTNPPMAAALLAILIYLLPVQVPAAVLDALAFVGDITSPLAMILIGATLAGSGARGLLSRPRLIPALLCKLLLLPVLTWAVLLPFPLDPVVRSTLILLSAMPCGANSAAYALQFGGDAEIASSMTFASTILCIATLPLMAALVVFR